MFNARDLLGGLLQSGMTGSAPRRLEHAAGPQGLGGEGGPLAGVRGDGGTSRGGTGGGGASGGGLGGLLGAAKDMLGGGTRAAAGGSPLAGGGIGALIGGLFGGGGGAAKGAMGGGLLALLSGVASSALNGKGRAEGAGGGAEPSSAPLGLREPQDPAEEEALDRRSLLLVRAMINAAKADGAIDDGEVRRITGKLDEADTEAEARAFVEQEMRKPMDLDALVRDVPDRETAVQVYAASMLAIEVDTPAERDYLRQLAQRLGIEGRAVETVHRTLGAPATG